MFIEYNNEILDSLYDKYPEYMETEFVYDGYISTVRDLLYLILDTYDHRTHQNKNTSANDVIKRYLAIKPYKDVVSKKSIYWHINRLIKLMADCNLSEVDRHLHMVKHKTNNKVEIMFSY